MEIGPYSIVVSGPAEVILNRTTGILVTSTPSVTGSTNGTTTTTPIYPFDTITSSTWSESNPTFVHPWTSNTTTYYDTFQLTAPLTGMYAIRSNSSIDTFGCLYNDSFVPENPILNLIVCDDDGGNNNQFLFDVHLIPHARYILVATAFGEKKSGSYIIIVSGNAMVNILRTTIMVTTESPSTTDGPVNTTQSPVTAAVNTTLWSMWTASNPTFARPSGRNSSYFYDTFELTVFTSGWYAIGSKSNIDTYGCIYNGNFLPENPYVNSIECNDDGESNQFRFEVNLEADIRYTLMATTYNEATIGPYAIVVAGLARVNLNRTTMLHTISTTPTTGYQNSTTRSPNSTVSTTVSSIWTVAHPTYMRPNSGNRTHFYDTFNLFVSTLGSYIITSKTNIDTYGCLYNGSFIPEYPDLNALICDDDGSGSSQFRIEVRLGSSTSYTLLATTFGPMETGPYSIVVSGPEEVILNRTTSILVTSTPSVTGSPNGTTTTTPIYPFDTTTSSTWSENNPTFVHPWTSNTATYYDTFELTVPLTGMYAIRSNSSIDTFGCLYNDNFVPENPTLNLIVCNDDGGSYNQFQLDVHLIPNARYILVATAFGEKKSGSYIIIVSGNAMVNILRTTIMVTTESPSTTDGPVNTTQSPVIAAVNTTLWSMWTPSNPTFTRPSGRNSSYFYDTFELTVFTSGWYAIGSKSNIDTYGCIYNGNFLPENPYVNSIECNDDGESNQFRFEVNLEADIRYTLMATTYNEATIGRYAIVVAGLAEVNLNLTTMLHTISTTPTTGYPNNTTRFPNSTVSTTVSSIWTVANPTYMRPNSGNRTYFYDTYNLSIFTPGNYIITSKSTLDTYGCLYNGIFIPEYPELNLFTCDNDGGDDGQFEFRVHFGSSTSYTLMATTFGPMETGPYSIVVSGPAEVNLTWTTLVHPTATPSVTGLTNGTTTTTPIYPFDTITSSTWSENNPTFVHPWTSNTTTYYDTFELIVPMARMYAIRSNSSIDTFGCLYNDSFLPENPALNVILCNDDGGSYNQFQLEVHLIPYARYILVATAFGGKKSGSYTIIVSGYAMVYISRTTIMVTTESPSTTDGLLDTTQSPVIAAVNTTLWSMWTPSNPTFTRPGGRNSSYFYDTFDLTVFTSGWYAIGSESNIDTIGCIYNGNFLPENPVVNSIACSDDGESNQFRFEVNLEANVRYILMATTYNEATIGPYAIVVAGLARVNLNLTTMLETMSTTPTTGDPNNTTRSPNSTVSTTVSSIWTVANPTYMRPNIGNRTYFYDTYNLSIFTPGIYFITSKSILDTYGCLYNGIFIPKYPELNLLICDNDGGGNGQFAFEARFGSSTSYTLMATTFVSMKTGAYSIVVSGPAEVNLTRTTSILVTSTPLVTGSTNGTTITGVIPEVNTTLWSMWTASNPTFTRPNGRNSTYFYDTFDLMAFNSGWYGISSESKIDTYGCLYSPRFLPENPYLNSIVCNDHGNNNQFQLGVFLEAYIKYTLVATTYDEHTIGPYAIVVNGLAKVNLNLTTVPQTISTTPTTGYTHNTTRPPNSIVNTTVSSIWTVAHPTYMRPNNQNRTHYYDTYSLVVSTPGNYTIASMTNIDTYGCLYNASFIPEHPDLNALICDDDGAGNRQFGFELYLEPSTRYTLLATTFGPMETGPYSIVVSGSAEVNLTRITSILVTSTPSVTGPTNATTITSPIYPFDTIASSTWSENSPTFVHPWSSNTTTYYDTFQLIAPLTGMYAIRSNSSIDTFGCLYNDNFVPEDPTLNLIVCDDDGGNNNQFRLEVNLISFVRYVLVATPFGAKTSGSYMIIVSGNAVVNLLQTTVTGTTLPPLTTGMPNAFNTSYWSTWSASNPTYARPGGSGSNYYYDTFDMIVYKAGIFVISSSSSVDTFGSIYNGTFTAEYPAQNLASSDDNGGEDNQFRLVVYLESNVRYTLVITTHHENSFGSYKLVVSGPTRVNLIRTTVMSTMTMRPSTGYSHITTQNPLVTKVNTTVSSMWTATNPTYMRPNNANRTHYYDTYDLFVSVAGNYTIASNSSIDTYGCFYNGDFIPERPDLNSLICDDDGGGDRQFGFHMYLAVSTRYTLLATTYGAMETASYSIIVSGPAQVNLIKTTPNEITVMSSTTRSSSTTTQTNPPISFGNTVVASVANVIVTTILLFVINIVK